MKDHRPPQVLLGDETTYFVTGRTYAGLPHLFSKEKKDIFKDILVKKVEKFFGEIINWVILSNHYHILINFQTGSILPQFIKELHGSSSYLIKKLPSMEVFNEEQIIIRNVTPLEKRREKEVEEKWRELKFATTESSVIANFSLRQDERRLKSATTTSNVIVDPSPRKGDCNPRFTNIIANFSLRNKESLEQAIKDGNYFLFKTIYLSSMPDIPFWYSYYSHVIRNEKDYYCHFNYITQNPIKHNLVKNLWDYPYSGVFNYDRDYILDSLRKYPIIDFGGEYD